MDIERRVERLERENRRLKVAGGAVVAVLLTVRWWIPPRFPT